MIEKFNYYLGMVASSWLLSLMVVVADLYAPFKDLLKGVFTHHWIGKLVIVLLAFLLVGYLFKDKGSILGMPSEKAAWYSAIGSLAVMFLFFVVEFIF